MIKHFSKKIQNEIQKCLFNANHSIKVAVAWFTNEMLFMPIMMKLQLGLDVEIVLNYDDINVSDENPIDFDSFINSGGKLHWNRSGQLMHDKFCIVDNTIVITGSYNWTNKAEYNDESISIFMDETETTVFYLNKFIELCKKYRLEPKKQMPLPTTLKEEIPLTKQTEDKPIIVSNLIAEGKCGDSIYFQLDKHGNLSFSGDGAIPDFMVLEDRPWHKYSDQIIKVYFEWPSASISRIGAHAFKALPLLKEVVFGGKVQVIGEAAFMGCSALKTVSSFSSVVRKLEKRTFYNCSSLQSIPCIDIIDDYAFYGCVALLDRPIKHCNANHIGSHAFERCCNLSSVILPDTLRSLGSYAFANCSSLSEIHFQDRVDHIGENVFYGCSLLKRVSLPYDVLYDSSAFNGFNDKIITTYYEDLTYPQLINPQYKGQRPPFFPNEKEVVRVWLSDIPNYINQPFGAFTIHKDDIVMIDKGEPCVVISRFKGQYYYLLSVIRNNKKSWLNLGILTRCDAFGQPLGEFQKTMLSYDTWEKRLNYLMGRTLKGGDLFAKEILTFTTAVKKLSYISDIIME